jgi:hypothetical protein
MRDLDNLREWRKNQREHELEMRRERKRQNYHAHWSYSTIDRHERRGMVVEFTKEWLEQKARETQCCELCGDELRWEPVGFKGMYPNTPTLDRVSNEKVLTTENVMILCNSCNAGKGVQSLDEYIDKCKRIANKFTQER